jgi:hypothetical protein
MMREGGKLETQDQSDPDDDGGHFDRLYLFDDHSHPEPTPKLGVEFVDYARRDGRGRGLFVFEPEGSVPELESQRLDEQHILIADSSVGTDLGAAMTELHLRLQPAYGIVSFARGSRQELSKLFDRLKRTGARHLWLRRDGDADDEEHWELLGRNKDVDAARPLVQR